MKTWIKGAIIGLIIWILLLLIFLVGGINYQCDIPEDLMGVSCLSPIQENVVMIIDFISFPLPGPGINFNLFSVFFFILWGMLIGFIFGKIKSRKRK